MNDLALACSVNAVNLHQTVTKLLAMNNTLYIAETDGKNSIAAIWFKAKGRKSPRVFDAAKDRFDPNEAAEFSGASEAEIARWLLARSKPFSG